MNRTKRLFAVVLAVVLCLGLFTGCADKEEVPSPRATIRISGYGDVLIELYPESAPNTVANFISLAESGYYDGTVIPRVETSLVQLGSNDGTVTSNAGYYIEGEFSANGYKKNKLKNLKGSVGMCRTTEDYNSASDQFYILIKEDMEEFDGEYCVFAYVVDGLQVLQQLRLVDTDSNGKPYKDIVIESVTVDTYGVDYGEPETIEISADAE